MTYLCVAIFVRSLEQANADIALAAEAGADMVELRVDEFTNTEEVRRLIIDCTLPSIVTCRPTWEGGRCELPERDRVQFLKWLADTFSSYVDVELKAYQSVSNERDDNRRRHRPRTVVSSHDFQGRPTRLHNLLTELAETSADVNKIVWTARTIRDNLEAFEILQQHTKPTIALCMGEAGLISRVLAKKFNAFLTFTSLGKSDGTAPGQVSIDDMKRLYRWDAIGRNTKVYGVVAQPVAHSMSPAIHNAAFDKTGYDGVYLPLLVNEGYESFKAFMESFLAFAPLDLSGLSITIPHKQNALKYLQEKGAEIDPLAVSIGAVNTIVIERDSDPLSCDSDPLSRYSGGGLGRGPALIHDSESSTPNSQTPTPALPRSTGRGGNAAVGLRGLNTDYGAIMDSITAKLGIQRQHLSGKRVAVIGAGGAGRSAVAALAHYGATVVVYNRTKEKADELAAEFNGKSGKVVAAAIEKLCDSCCEIYLNTTSVGMHPNVDSSPFGDAPPKLSPDTLVFDTVYNPSRTKLLQQAQSAGAATIGGIEMFVRQAVAQFEAWTSLPAPVGVMRAVVERRLNGK
jgi:3-dehydroquinate dehydratase/shikimate dehydrogenase